MTKLVATHPDTNPLPNPGCAGLTTSPVPSAMRTTPKQNGLARARKGAFFKLAPKLHERGMAKDIDPVAFVQLVTNTYMVCEFAAAQDAASGEAEAGGKVVPLRAFRRGPDAGREHLKKGIQNLLAQMGFDVDPALIDDALDLERRSIASRMAQGKKTPVKLLDHRTAGKAARLTLELAQELGISCMHPIDESDEERERRKREKERRNSEQRRRRQGARPQKLSAHRLQPWVAEGMAKSTWYKHRYQDWRKEQDERLANEADPEAGEDASVAPAPPATEPTDTEPGPREEAAAAPTSPAEPEERNMEPTVGNTPGTAPGSCLENSTGPQKGDYPREVSNTNLHIQGGSGFSPELRVIETPPAADPPARLERPDEWRMLERWGLPEDELTELKEAVEAAPDFDGKVRELVQYASIAQSTPEGRLREFRVQIKPRLDKALAAHRAEREREERRRRLEACGLGSEEIAVICRRFMDQRRARVEIELRSEAIVEAVAGGEDPLLAVRRILVAEAGLMTRPVLVP